MTHPYYKKVPIAWKSDVSGKEYDYEEYINHGKGDIYRGFKDLPHNEYPYTIVTKKVDCRLTWWRKDQIEYDCITMK